MPLIKTSEAALHYQLLGEEGESVVLIHGLGANLAFWYWGSARPIARRARVVTYDLRGHGRSTMPQRGYRLSDMSHDLDRLLDSLGVESAHLVGHSFGARVALAYAGKRPERVRSVTVADTQIRALQPQIRLRDWSYWPRWKRDLQAQGHVELPGDDDWIDFRLLAQFNQIAHGQIAHGKGAASRNAGGRRISMRSRDMGPRSNQRWRSLLGTTTAKRDFADESPLTASFLKRITAPTLLLYGQYSHCCQSSDKLLDLIPNCRRVVIPGAGHFLPAIKPLFCAYVISRFISEDEFTETADEFAEFDAADFDGFESALPSPF